MQAVLTDPIVTDYVPAAKPPLMLLAVVVAVQAAALPREVLPEFVAACAAVALGCWGAVRWLTRNSPAAG